MSIRRIAQVRRRDFIAALGGAVAWPLAVRAQQDFPRVGILITPGEGDPESRARIAAFRESLQKLGWIDGKNIRLEFRWGGGDSSRIKAHAMELVSLSPKAIIGNGTPAVEALSHLTRTVPIIFALIVDPVGQGYIDSFARPGRNITGFTFIDFSMVGKWLEILKALAPATNRAALIYNPNTTPYWAGFLRSGDAARVSTIARLVGMPVQTAAELESAITEFAREPGGSLIFPPDPFNVVNFKLTAPLAQLLRLPSISAYRNFAEGGGLAAYGPDTSDAFRRAASYVDRILKGESPANLPAQNPDKFELVINLKTAKALGLDVSATLATADEVIE
jgi:putative ABC transport system substrate-binding protein